MVMIMMMIMTYNNDNVDFCPGQDGAELPQRHVPAEDASLLA